MSLFAASASFYCEVEKSVPDPSDVFIGGLDPRIHTIEFRIRIRRSFPFHLIVFQDARQKVNIPYLNTISRTSSLKGAYTVRSLIVKGRWGYGLGGGGRLGTGIIPYTKIQPWVLIQMPYT